MATKAKSGDREGAAASELIEPESDGSSTLRKTLSILDLFTPEQSIWSTSDIISALGVSRSTGYRYIKSLNSVGLLGAVGNGYYVLGSRIIELDFQIRSTDPLILASQGVLDELADATGQSAILCMLFQSSVLCIDERRAQLSPKSLFSRGQRRPLFRGALSRVILAHLPNHRLRSIYTRRKVDIEASDLGASWDEFREMQAAIRTAGCVQSVGEFNPEIVGIAAPVFNAEDAIIGSIGCAFSKHELAHVDVERITLLTKRAGREISQRMASSSGDHAGLVLQPRAVG